MLHTRSFTRLAAQVAPRCVAAAATSTRSPLSATAASTLNTTITTSIRSLTPIVSRRSYHQNVLDHYKNPRNVGSMPKDDPHVASALVGAPACGDVIKLDIRIDPATNKIIESKFKTFGCGSAIASSSYLTELVKGMSLDEAARIKNVDISRELCLPPVKLHCSLLAEDAIKSAIKNYHSKRAAATNLAATPASTLADVTASSATPTSAAAAA